MHPRHLPSTFSGSVEPSVNFCQHIACRGTLQKRSVQPRIFHQLSVQLRDLPSTSVCWGNFCQLPSTFHVCKGPSVNFPCISGTFRQLPSTFRAMQDLPPTCVDSMFVSRTFSRFPLTICASMGPSKNVLCTRWTFRQLQTTFRAVVGPSGNSQCGAGHSYKLLQLSMQLWYLLQLSMRSQGLLSTLRAATGLQLTSINFLCISGTFDNI